MFHTDFDSHDSDFCWFQLERMTGLRKNMLYCFYGCLFMSENIFLIVTFEKHRLLGDSAQIQPNKTFGNFLNFLQRHCGQEAAPAVKRMLNTFHRGFHLTRHLNAESVH